MIYTEKFNSSDLSKKNTSGERVVLKLTKEFQKSGSFVVFTILAAVIIRGVIFWQMTTENHVINENITIHASITHWNC